MHLLIFSHWFTSILRRELLFIILLILSGGFFKREGRTKDHEVLTLFEFLLCDCRRFSWSIVNFDSSFVISRDKLLSLLIYGSNGENVIHSLIFKFYINYFMIVVCDGLFFQVCTILAQFILGIKVKDTGYLYPGHYVSFTSLFPTSHEFPFE